MWDFSWLERRWPGAGYEDPRQAIRALKDRGYNAIRIDAYPHLVAEDSQRTWELVPCWTTQDWGAPARCRVRVQPALNEFVALAAGAGMKIGLSTWFREDTTKAFLKIKTPADLGQVWKRTLDTLAGQGLLRHILYVDLCNEFPLDIWTPFIQPSIKLASPQASNWMRESIAVVRRAYPQLPYTFSFTSEYAAWRDIDVQALDFLELHLWMTHFSDFYKQVGYTYDRFSAKSYDNLALNGESLYRQKPEFWKSRLDHGIDLLTAWSLSANKPLVTTECWSIVDYKDFPMLDWGWIRELCEHGTRRACSTGRWAAVATSNFCGPQFRGMWRDIEWHRKLTRLIRAGKSPGPLKAG